MFWKAVAITVSKFGIRLSSSVYGGNRNLPFGTTCVILVVYGATKKANELMKYFLRYLYGLPTTGLRFHGLWPLGAP